MKKVLLITPGQPSVNPRVVKEATALHNAGFDVTLLYCHFVDWATAEDNTLLSSVSWKYKMIGGAPSISQSRYFISRLRFKISRLLNQYLGNRYGIAERAQARCYKALLHAAKEIKADWYIGHNLGALAVAVKAAAFNQARAGFDFEDYHREENVDMPLFEQSRIKFLEEKYVPGLHYLSAASPMISDRIKADFPFFSGPTITLLNCFPLSEQPAFRTRNEKDRTLNLFWFSQTIGLNRGLEIVLEAMAALNDANIHLTLAGRCDLQFAEFVGSLADSLKKQVHFAGIIAPAELATFAAKFDVGLALELSIPENRNICLTNKIFTYLLAGNAMLLSNTAMQEAFNQKYSVGTVFSQGNIDQCMTALQAFRNIEMLEEARRKNYHLSETLLNWETESKALIRLLSSTL